MAAMDVMQDMIPGDEEACSAVPHVVNSHEAHWCTWAAAMIVKHVKWKQQADLRC